MTSSQSSLATSLQRLSTGLRINSAKDDAAGLAISERFTAQINGLNQAARNANDGISLAQTAEGAMGQATDLLQRIRELSIQSANATNSASDRSALQEEVTQLVSELDRISTTTQFNGLNLLDGSFVAQDFQVGANAGQTLQVASITSTATATLGINSTASATGTALTAAIGASDLTINTVAVAATSQDALAIATAITATGADVTATATNAQTAITYADVVGVASPTSGTYAGAVAVPGTTADYSTNNLTFDVAVDGGSVQNITISNTATTPATLASSISSAITGASAAIDGSGNLVITSASTGTSSTIAITNVAGIGGTDFLTGGSPVVTAGAASADPTYTLSVDGTALDFTSAGTTITGTETAALINALDGYTASYSGSNLSITKADGSNIVLIEGGSDSDASEGLAGDGSSSAVTETYRGTVDVVSSGADLVIGGTDPTKAGLTAGTTAVADAAGTAMAAVDISTASGAQTAIDIVDRALNELNSGRASLGALQSRFEAIVTNLTTSSENLSAARSRIRDTDFAAETAALTRAQILQQAGTAMLAQANALPQNVLSLLG